MKRLFIIKKAFRFILPFIALAAGVGVMIGMIKTKPKAKQKPVDHRGTLVEIIKVEAKLHNVDVYAYGTVSAEYVQMVSPEVGGRIVWLNEDIEIGAHLNANEKVARVDGRDYWLAIQQQRARVDSARTALQLEQGRRRIAKREWKIMGGKKLPQGSLAWRDPQLRTARMQIRAARSGLQRSQLHASKTLIRAPFNGVVIAKHVSKRQLVLPGAPLITLASTDRFLVSVSVPLRRLEWINVPGITGVKPGGGSDVEVRQQVGKKFVVRAGKVIRLNAQLDPRGRMAQLIIAIDDPLQLKKDAAAVPVPTDLKPEHRSKLPLLIGAFVKVRITGKSIDSAVEVPRVALQNDSQVYVLSKHMKLDIRTVSIRWRLENTVLVVKGLNTGDLVIISPLPVPIKGMKLRLPAKNAAKAKSPGSVTTPSARSKSASVGKP